MTVRLSHIARCGEEAGNEQLLRALACVQRAHQDRGVSEPPPGKVPGLLVPEPLRQRGRARWQPHRLSPWRLAVQNAIGDRQSWLTGSVSDVWWCGPSSGGLCRLWHKSEPFVRAGSFRTYLRKIPPRIIPLSNGCASTGHGGKGNKMVFPVSCFDQRIGSRVLIPPALLLFTHALPGSRCLRGWPNFSDTIQAAT